MPIIVVSRISSVAEAVDAEEVLGADRRNPGRALDELEARALCASNQNHSGTEIRKPASATRFAIQRIAFSFRLFTNSSRTAPASGVKQNQRKVMAHKIVVTA